jgi:hypothetical protein
MAGLKTGDIIEFDYTSPNANDPHPITMFLNDYEGQIHALNLKNLSASQRRHYLLLMKTKYYKYKIDPLDFYNAEIAGKIKGNAYRTYNPKYMKNIQFSRTSYNAQYTRRPTDQTVNEIEKVK